MLCRADELRKYELRSVGDSLGKIEDFYFDDRFWTIRYLVIDTGGWLVGRRVLVSPWAVAAVDMHSDTIATKLTKAQLEAGPSPDEHAPVSRQFEIAYHEYYHYSPYWIGPLAWGAYGAPFLPEDAALLEETVSWDSHLYSTNDLTGLTRYRVVASDGHVGHVSDVVISDRDWVIRYLVIDTRDWLPGKHVLVPPQWTQADWETATLTVDLTRDAIKAAPAFIPGAPLDRDFETKLFAHYCRAAYWTDDAVCYDLREKGPADRG